MTIESCEKKHRQTLCGKMLLCGVIFSLFSILFTWVDSIISSDILLRNSFFSTVLRWFILLSALAMHIFFYSGTVYALYAYGFRRSLPLIFTILGVTLLHSIIDALSRLFLFGIDTTDFVLYELPFDILSFGLEFLQYGLILGISVLCLRRFPRSVDLVRNDDGSYREALPHKAFPFQKILDSSNPVLFSLFFISLAVMLLQILSRTVYDIRYGSPTSLSETVYMVFAYLSDILLYGVIHYFATRWLTEKIEKSYRRTIEKNKSLSQ